MTPMLRLTSNQIEALNDIAGGSDFNLIRFHPIHNREAPLEPDTIMVVRVGDDEIHLIQTDGTVIKPRQVPVEVRS